MHISCVLASNLNTEPQHNNNKTPSKPKLDATKKEINLKAPGYAEDEVSTRIIT